MKTRPGLRSHVLTSHVAAGCFLSILPEPLSGSTWPLWLDLLPSRALGICCLPWSLPTSARVMHAEVMGHSEMDLQGLNTPMTLPCDCDQAQNILSHQSPLMLPPRPMHAET